MTPKTTTAPTIALGATASGYCGKWYPGQRGFCTRPPHADKRHVDHYRGKKAITDAEGYVWTCLT